MYKKIAGIFIICLIAVSCFSGCTNFCKKQSDDFYIQKIAEYFSNRDWPDDYIELGEWDCDNRRFCICSYNPDAPENQDRLGGWAFGIIDKCGDISDVSYS